MRGTNFFIGIGVINIIIWLKSTYYDPTFGEEKKKKSQKELEGN
jgi:hypothetical protein